MRTTRRNARVARMLYRLCLVDGLLDESRARLVVRRMVEARRRRSLAILSHFQRLVRLDGERHTAHVESAAPLADDLRAVLTSGIVGLYGPGVETVFDENRDLIGGIRVRVGSHVFDGSVRGRLAAIAARL